MAAYKAPGYTYIVGLAWSSVQSGREGELFSLCTRDQANSIMWLSTHLIWSVSISRGWTHLTKCGDAAKTLSIRSSRLCRKWALTVRSFLAPGFTLAFTEALLRRDMARITVRWLWSGREEGEGEERMRKKAVVTLVSNKRVVSLLPKVYWNEGTSFWFSIQYMHLPLSHHTLPELVGGGVLLGREEGPHQTHVWEPQHRDNLIWEKILVFLKESLHLVLHL